MPVTASKFFSKDQQAQIRDAIYEAEAETSGEIRVHIETYVTGDVLDRAAWIFKKIGMHGTVGRNGVLFYLAIQNRKFAIIGDSGINQKVPENFWDDIKNVLQLNFRNDNFTEGLIDGIRITGKQLKQHFPRMTDDINELPDEISFDSPE